MAEVEYYEGVLSDLVDALATIVFGFRLAHSGRGLPQPIDPERIPARLEQLKARVTRTVALLEDEYMLAARSPPTCDGGITLQPSAEVEANLTCAAHEARVRLLLRCASELLEARSAGDPAAPWVFAPPDGRLLAARANREALSRLPEGAAYLAAAAVAVSVSLAAAAPPRDGTSHPPPLVVQQAHHAAAAAFVALTEADGLSPALADFAKDLNAAVLARLPSPWTGELALPDTVSEEEAVARVAAFYTAHKPEKVGDAKEIVAAYAGRLPNLAASLNAKYLRTALPQGDVGAGELEAVASESSESRPELPPLETTPLSGGDGTQAAQTSPAKPAPMQYRPGMSKEEIARELQVVYSASAPDKISDIPEIMRRFEGKADELFARINAKYCTPVEKVTEETSGDKVARTDETASEAAVNEASASNCCVQ